MDFCFRVAIAVFPFGMKCVHEIKCPYEIRAGCSAPDCYGVILVGEFVEGVGNGFREIGFKDAHRRAEHLDSLE